MIPRREYYVRRGRYWIALVLHFVAWAVVSFLRLGRLPRTREVRSGNVLFVGPSHLGDLLILTPAIRLLKRRRPDLNIYVLASKGSRAVMMGNNDVAGVVDFVSPWFDAGSPGMIKSLQGFARLIRTLQFSRTEYCINFFSVSYYREHFAMWIAGVRNRVGFAHKGFDFCLTKVFTFQPDKNVVEQVRDLVAFAFDLDVDENDLQPKLSASYSKEEANIFVDQLRGKSGRKVVALNIGARHTFLWRVENYVRLLELLSRWNQEILFVFVGTAEDLPAVDRIIRASRVRSLSFMGKTSLPQMAAILEHGVDLLITVDTGIRHLANAVGCRVLVLQNGASRYEYWAKYVDTETILNYRVPCSPCGHLRCPLEQIYCMERISVEKVFEEARRALCATRKRT